MKLKRATTQAVREAILNYISKDIPHGGDCRYGYADSPDDFINECVCCNFPEKCYCFDCDNLQQESK